VLSYVKAWPLCDQHAPAIANLNFMNDRLHVEVETLIGALGKWARETLLSNPLIYNRHMLVRVNSARYSADHCTRAAPAFKVRIIPGFHAVAQAYVRCLCLDCACGL
jgi:hypothetical protein